MMEPSGAETRASLRPDRRAGAGRRSVRLLTLGVALLVLLELAWGMASCLGGVAASRTAPAQRDSVTASRPA